MTLGVLSVDPLTLEHSIFLNEFDLILICEVYVILALVFVVFIASLVWKYSRDRKTDYSGQ